ncbi:hypothetical protein BGZ65_007390, partial [Modicella reniformis]
MKINTQSIILSLVAASTVIAAPAPIQKRNWVVDKLKPLFSEAVKTLSCTACVAALIGVKEVSLLNKNWVLSAGRELCPALAKQAPEVCDGMVELYGNALIESVIKADISSGDGKLICHSLGSLCPAPAVTSGTLTFPKPKPAKPVAPTASGQLIDVLHLSDWHVDELYAPGSEAVCGKPTCCRKFTDSPTTPQRAASSWGDYGCDTPVKLTQDLLKYIPKVANVSFAVMTGD